MATRVTNNNSVRGPLYTPVLGDGAHRLGAIGLSDLANVSPERVYTPVDNFNGAPAPRQITVGEYYRQRAGQGANAFGRVVHGIVELAPPVLLGEMAVIKLKHDKEAYERIYNLPWDPAGKWKIAADQIKREENAEANAEIAGLPLPSAARATGAAVSNAWTAVGDYASAATTEAIDSSRRTGRGIMRGLLSELAMVGQGMVDWARRNKPAFE